MVGGKRHEKDKGNKCNVSPWGKNLTRPHGPMPAKGLKVPPLPPAKCSCLQKPLPLSAQFREREPVRICELGYSDFNKFDKARTLKVGKCKSKTISNRSSEQASAQSFLFIFCVLEWPLLCLFYDSWKMSGLEPRELAVTSRRAIN